MTPLQPSPMLRRMLGALLPSTHRTEFLADLDDLFALRATRDGRRAAQRWYIGQCFAIPVTFALARVIGAPQRLGVHRSTSDRAPLTESLLHDSRLALRRLVHRPAWSLAVIGTISIGIAAISTVYSIANWMLLRPVPSVTRPQDVATVLLESGAPFGLPISNPDLRELQHTVTARRGLAAYTAQDVHLSTGAGDTPVRLPGEFVTANYFPLLGTALLAGRGFDAASDQPNGGQVVVISDGLRRQHWPSAAIAIGKVVTINGWPFTVIGVTPTAFHGAELPGKTVLWLPGGAAPFVLHNDRILADPASQLWQVMIARLPTATERTRTGAELARAVAAIRARKGPSSFMALGWAFVVHRGIGLPPGSRAAVARTLTILMVAAVLFLLLTCANVANIGFTRALSLRPTLAIQRYLGATSGRMLRERLMESLFIGVAGGACGVALAAIATARVRGSGIGDVPLDFGATLLDVRVVTVSVLAAVVAAVVAGLIPAVGVLRSGNAALAVRSARPFDRHSSRLRKAMVVAQVALSTVLVVNSGLLARTLHNLHSIPLGFAGNNVLVFSLDPEMQGYGEPRTAALIDAMRQQLARDPQVASVAFTQALGAFGNFYIPTVFARPGSSKPDDHVVARTFRVSPSFMPVLGLHLDGGNFNDDGWLVRDSTAEQVAIVNAAAVRALLPGVDPRAAVGRLVQPIGAKAPLRIIGVINDARLANLMQPAEPYVLRPWNQGFKDNQLTVYVRTRGDPLQAAAGIREVMRRIDPALPVYDESALSDMVAAQFADQRLVAWLASVLGVASTMLAALGLYSLLAQLVIEQRREIGIRRALGALSLRVVVDVVRNGVGMAVAGLVVGVIATAYGSRFLASRLFGVPPIDPLTYAGGVALLVVVAVIACWLPARRATQVTISDALREG